MGFWWDMFQQYQIGQQDSRSGNAEERIAGLEQELDTVYQVLEQMANRLDELEQAAGMSTDNG